MMTVASDLPGEPIRRREILERMRDGWRLNYSCTVGKQPRAWLDRVGHGITVRAHLGDVRKMRDAKRILPAGVEGHFLRYRLAP